MTMFQKAYNNIDINSLSTSEQSLFNQQYQDFILERELLEKEGAYEIDYNVNASLNTHHGWSYYLLNVHIKDYAKGEYFYNPLGFNIDKLC